ncbi:hypothetical protein IAT38_003467 [Cryptococcus sp. DSM 104549]
MPAAHAPLSDSFLDAKAQNSRRMSGYDASRNQRTAQPSALLPAVPENHGGAPVPAAGVASATTPVLGAPSGSPPLTSPSPPPSSYKKGKRIVAEPGWGRHSSTGSIGSGVSEDDSPLTMDRRRSPDKGKGKSRDVGGTPSAGTSGSSLAMWGIPEEQTVKRANWVVDPVEMQLGTESWADDLRIVLVLGSPNPDALAPMLYNPTFANTLILIGSYKPLPAIEALLSPSHLMSASPDRTIYPTLQPFTPTIRPGDDEQHALTALLTQGQTLAKQYRTRAPRSTRSRQSSFGSQGSASGSPPASPGMRARVFSGLSPSRRGSMDSMGSDRARRSSSFGATGALPTVASTASLQTTRTENRRSRSSIFGGIFKFDSENRSSSSSSGDLFDAVINFLPSASNFKPGKDMQMMLHQAVVITTAVVPTLMRTLGKPSSDDSDKALPITVLHVLPQKAPQVLSSVLESFLLSLIPSFQNRCAREIFPCVVTSPVWLSPLVEMAQGRSSLEDGVSGAEVLLLGGVRAPAGQNVGSYSPRAYLASWGGCMSMPGLIAEARRPSNTRSSSSSGGGDAPPRAAAPKRNSTWGLVDPPTVGSDAVSPRTPPQSTPDIFSQAALPLPPLPASSPSMSTPSSSPSPPQPSFSPTRVPLSPPQLPAGAAGPASASGPGPGVGYGLGINTNPQRRSKLSSVAAIAEPPSAPASASAPASDRPRSPPTPELEPSASSCSSSFALGETGSQGSAGSAGSGGTSGQIQDEVRIRRGEGEMGEGKWESGNGTAGKEGKGLKKKESKGSLGFGSWLRGRRGRSVKA